MKSALAPLALLVCLLAGPLEALTLPGDPLPLFLAQVDARRPSLRSGIVTAAADVLVTSIVVLPEIATPEPPHSAAGSGLLLLLRQWNPAPQPDAKLALWRTGIPCPF